MERLNIASFFAGIGGFDLGFERASFQVNFQCEINSYCNFVLKHHWPELDISSDISKLEADSIPNADIWCGGFPCQDLSVARGSNGRHGLSGTRSGLFFKLAELASLKQPKVILIENVPGLLNSNNGKDFAELLHTLNKLNYAVSWRLLNSRYFGVPQSRSRIYICAWLDSPISSGNVLFEDSSPLKQKNERAGFLETSCVDDSGPIVPKLAYCLAATSGRHTGTDWSRTYVSYKNAVRRLTPLECERLQGFPDSWTMTDSMPIDPEKSDSLRYHALGNAVSVVVVEWLAKRILEQKHNINICCNNMHNNNVFIKESLERWPNFRANYSINNKLDTMMNSVDKIKWPSAGLLWKGNFIASNTPQSICSPIASDFNDLVEKTIPDERYFLSPNAAEGILRRVDSQNRQLFLPLRNALEKLSGRKKRSKIKSEITIQPQVELQL